MAKGETCQIGPEKPQGECPITSNYSYNYNYNYNSFNLNGYNNVLI